VDPQALVEALRESLSPSEAARLAARVTGLPKSALYRKALARAK
jgi:16S rRNA (cytidine1402-2'-O)-methyltransferase